MQPPKTQSPNVTILSVGQGLAAALGLDGRRAEAVLVQQASKTGQPLPRYGTLVPGAGSLPPPQAMLVFSYAVCALLRGGTHNARDASQQIADYLGIGTVETNLALQVLLKNASRGHSLDGSAALASFFEPDEWVRGLAKTVMQHVDLRRDRRPVNHIAPSQYEHPDDRRALDAVRSVTGVELALRKLSELGVEKVQAIETIANCVRVGPRQFPELHALFCEAVEMLGMPQVPDLFLKAMGPGAYTVGIQSPRVVLSSALPSLLTRDEMLFVMGHELGHVRSGHAPFLLLRRYLPVLAEIVGHATLGVGLIVGMGMQAVLMDWYRKSELTCDRCGLLVCQNSDAALSALMKFAGTPMGFYRQMNLDAFIDQAEEFDRLDTSILSKLYKFDKSLENDHPWLAVRARELTRWIRSGDYQALLHGTNTVSPPSARAVCRGCGTKLSSEDVFCSACGAKAE